MDHGIDETAPGAGRRRNVASEPRVHPRCSTPTPSFASRVVVEAEDYEEAVRFFRDILGMPELAAFAEGDEDRVAILEAGVATLEIASPAHKRAIDRVEADGQVSPRIRLALEVDDATATTATLAREGGTVVAEPVETPWRSLNSRLDVPAGLQITLFQELETRDQRTAHEGFATDR